MKTSLPLAIALVLAAPAATQGALDAAFRRPLPIHTQPDDPAGGSYGYWTAAADFKARFDDGFTFYPWLPGALETRGLRWQTSSVRLGAQELLPAACEVRVQPERYELGRGNLTERYDVRAEGIEQSFCLAERPAGDGDLVIEGKVTTAFTAAHVTARHGAIDFASDGALAMRYGAAIAFDREGHRADVATSFDGEHIRLHVQAAFVAAATFPLTIDPLSSNVALRLSTQPNVATSMTCATAPLVERVILAVVREFSATDLDAYAFLSGENPAPTMFDLFSDVTTSWSTTTVELAEVSGANRWALAFERDFGGGVTGARVYLHSFSSTALNTGTTLFPATNTRAPRLGGALGAGTKLLLLYGSGADCMQQIVDGQNLTLGAVQLHQAGASEWAASRGKSPGQRWCVAINDGAAIRVRLVDDAGGLDASHVFPDTNGATGPELDGNGVRFLLTYTQTGGTIVTRRLQARRFDMSFGGAPTVQPVRTLASVPLLTGIGRRQIAYDFQTTSHWVLGFHLRSALGSFQGKLLRLGFTGAVTESVDCNAVEGIETLLPCVAYNGVQATGSSFSAGYAALGALQNELLHRRFDYSPQAGVSFYGTSCATVTLGDGHPPYAGSQFYRLNLGGVAPGSICLHAVGVSPASVDLTPIGMTSCNLLVDAVLTTGVIADATG
ncbi:MAG TPA: hypothetical protein VFZ65_13795, partial [Planctomycetota bacterium]|nr:hypothetical protein [Planctomycetota bacterium]